ncbi:MAG: winged helix-turn-helix transcriptional regulator [Bacteroidales bacterium]|jgi:DNA-binding transcriptional ArsR family regulator|nr:winged helix-turn-helix transcriptional regulator [Bacteroidales bacterium]
MRVSRKSSYTDAQQKMAVLLKALGHPARVAIMEHLLKVNACICNDIVDELPLAQPTVSQHLKELKNAGLIKGSIEGNTICYCINEKGIEKLNHYFSIFSSQLIKQENDYC